VRENDIKVVITGEASDEILFGYDSYKEIKLLQFWARSPHSTVRPLLIKRLYPHLEHYANTKAYGLMKLYYEDFLDTTTNSLAGLNIRISNNKVLAAALHKEYSIKFNQDDLIEKMKATFPPEYDNWTLLQQNQFLEMTTLLDGYLLSSQGDRMSLGHGIEGRFPFLDHRLVERTFSWPDSYKLKGFSQKHILRSAFHGRLPKSIIDRPKLPYQAPDLRAFIRNGKPVELVEYYLSMDMIRGYGVFDERFVARFLKRFSERSSNQVGYRDNMLLVFILSAQIDLDCAHHIRLAPLGEELRTVNIIEPVERV
jgi:asparagine synthase (glutamine-hydrolysing)